MEATKPRLRGVLHEIAFYASLVTGPALIAVTKVGSVVGTTIYSIAMTALFGISALYHRPMWRPAVRRWLGRLDHTMILVFTAATFTPIALAIGTGWARVVLLSVWCGAFLATLIAVLPVRMPTPVVVIPYLTLGWFGLSLLPASFSRIGVTTPVLLIIGGLLYTIGAMAYARRRPNPSPAFGYHEVFHALVVVAAYVHYGAVAATVT